MENIFTIVIPTYNRQNIIGNAIECIKEQTYSNWELIIVDDGSTDNTEDVVKRYLNEDGRIKYIKQINMGPDSARNTGLQFALGDLIYFMDSDDVCFPNFLEKCFSEFEKDSSVGAVYCQTGLYRDGEIIQARNDVLEGNIYREALIQGYVTSPSFLTMRTETVRAIDGWKTDVGICGDDDICFRLANVTKFKLIDEVLGVFTVSGDDHFSFNKKKSADGWWKLWNKYENDVIKYCGKQVIFRHYYEVFHRYYDANDYDGMLNCMNKIRGLGEKIVFDGYEQKILKAVRRIIQALLDDGKENDDICIYPFGKIGKLTKIVLNHEFHIQEKYIFDRNSSQPYVISASKIKEKYHNNLIVIISSINKEIFYELRSEISAVFNSDNVYDIVREYV